MWTGNMSQACFLLKYEADQQNPRSKSNWYLFQVRVLWIIKMTKMTCFVPHPNIPSVDPTSFDLQAVSLTLKHFLWSSNQKWNFQFHIRSRTVQINANQRCRKQYHSTCVKSWFYVPTTVVTQFLGLLNKHSVNIFFIVVIISMIARFLIMIR